LLCVEDNKVSALETPKAIKIRLRKKGKNLPLLMGQHPMVDEAISAILKGD
jgi:hypothetical protein